MRERVEGIFGEVGSQGFILVFGMDELGTLRAALFGVYHGWKVHMHMLVKRCGP